MFTWSHCFNILQCVNVYLNVWVCNERLVSVQVINAADDTAAPMNTITCSDVWMCTIICSHAQMLKCVKRLSAVMQPMIQLLPQMVSLNDTDHPSERSDCRNRSDRTNCTNFQIADLRSRIRRLVSQDVYCVGGGMNNFWGWGDPTARVIGWTNFDTWYIYSSAITCRNCRCPK